MDDFKLIYEEYYDKVFAYLLKLCGDYHLAEELTQETFYQSYLSLHRFKGKSTLFTWLCAVAKNVYFKYMKRNRETPMEIGEILTDVAGEDDISEYLSSREVFERIRGEILGLSKKQRNVFVLRLYNELSYREIADVMNISESDAKVSYMRAREKLKKSIEGLFVK